MNRNITEILTRVLFVVLYVCVVMLLFISNLIFTYIIAGCIIICFILFFILFVIINYAKIKDYIRGFNIRRLIKCLSQDILKKRKPEKIFKINDIVELKLIQGKTHIYIKGKEFIQCMYLLLNIPVEEIEDYDEYESIDDIAERLDHSLEGNRGDIVIRDDVSNLNGVEFRGIELNIELNINSRIIDPETEFIGHCSNLQVFFENGLDTNILHSNIAFPLLKKLSEVKYEPAFLRFREEIVKRFNAGNDNVREFLHIEGYLNYLNEEELKCLDVDKYNESVRSLENIEVWRFV